VAFDISSELAYGARAAGSIPPHRTAGCLILSCWKGALKLFRGEARFYHYGYALLASS